MRYQIYLTIVLLLVSTVSQAAPTVQLEPGTGKYDLGLYADILEDQSGELTFEEITSDYYANQWIQNHQPIPSFAYSDSVYWLRITLTSEIQLPQEWWLEVAFALQDYIDYYLLYNGKIIREKHTGDRLNFNSRSVDYRNFLFEFDISPGDIRQIYLRFKTHDGLHEPNPIILWDKQTFSLANGIRNLGLGLYFGIMLAMTIYNLFLFIMIRDRTYAYYVLYIASFSFWLIFYYGFSFQYLMPNSPQLANQMGILSSSLWGIFVAVFIRSFLDTKRLVPWFDILSKITLAGMIFNVFFSFADYYSIGILILIIFGVFYCVAAFFAGFACLKKGFRPARYFLLAWSFLLSAIIVFVLKIGGILPSTFITEKSIQIGSIVEVILLSLGLADRINVLKNEKHLAQQEALQAFESSLKLKNDFITSISHELRTPMNAIVGGLEITKKYAVDHLKQPLDIINEGASDMIKIINDILTHTEIQSDGLTIKANHIHIQSLLKSFQESYRQKCEDKGLQLKWQIDVSVPEWVYTDEDKLSIILSKLLDNAIKYTDQGHVSVFIECDKSTSPWQFICVVKDTGIGIAQEMQEHIFGSFTQSESGFQRRYGGLGIGLTICKKLTQILGGEVKLESIMEQGSTFTVTFPIEPGGLKPITKKNTSLASADLPILIVEDNVVNQKVMKKLLEKIGFTSLVANNGKEALEILDKETISVILMDLQMPVMDGFACTLKIRSRGDHLKNIPIIAATANLMATDKERCIKCGMNDFLKKPIKIAKLRDSLSCYIAEAGKGVQH